MTKYQQRINKQQISREKAGVDIRSFSLSNLNILINSLGDEEVNKPLHTPQQPLMTVSPRMYERLQALSGQTTYYEIRKKRQEQYKVNIVE